MNILGLYTIGHDSGAALISGSAVCAISEERLNRVKHSRAFPARSIRYCLEALNVNAGEVDLIVLVQIYSREKYPVKKLFLAEVGVMFPKARIEVINHHDAHAASAFFCSPFEDAAILVHDGMGEAFYTHLGVPAIETETLYYGTGHKLVSIQKTTHFVKGRSISYTGGPGRMYTILSDKYLGFGPYNEGKMMGLAPYGDGSLFEAFPLERWMKDIHGYVVCNISFSWPEGPGMPREAKRGNQTFLQKIAEVVRDGGRKMLHPVADALARLVMPAELVGTAAAFSKINLPRPPRDPSVQLPDRYYASVAYAAQHVLEQAALANARKLRAITRAENLCVAGGLGLNIDTNKKFMDEVGFKHVFIQPAASDAGVPLGAALYGRHVISGQPRFFQMKSAALGRAYGESEIRGALRARESEIAVSEPADVCRAAAQLVADGKIISWFQGGSEYGPRALGQRSILCDARILDMRDILNNRVKRREPWRPFAASVLKERTREYFDLEEESPFMLLVAPVRKEKQSLIPAVVHVDGTCRVQTVTKEANGRYHDLIRNFAELTGMPLVLNTSFNLGGEPIVETPADALGCFLRADMDYLVLDRFIVSKKKGNS